MMYEPAEDSYLLGRVVKKHARGRVLDMGTGSGYQAKIAAAKRNVERVLAVDLNPDAISHVIEMVKDSDIGSNKVLMHKGEPLTVGIVKNALDHFLLDRGA